MYSLKEISDAALQNAARAKPPKSLESCKVRANNHLNTLYACFPAQLQHVYHSELYSERILFVLDYLALLSDDAKLATDVHCLRVCLGLRELEDEPDMILTPKHCCALEVVDLMQLNDAETLDPLFPVIHGLRQFRALFQAAVRPTLMVSITVAYGPKQVVFTNLLLYSAPIVRVMIGPQLKWDAWNQARVQSFKQLVEEIPSMEPMYQLWKDAPLDVQLAMCEADEMVRERMVTHLHLCAQCHVPDWAMRACSYCRAVTYCSESCQRTHWSLSHRKGCTRAFGKVPVVAPAAAATGVETVQSPLFDLD